MVRLTPEQATIKDKLTAQKRRYDAELSGIEAAYVDAKERAKDPIRQLVGEAQDAGIPQRQIHLALGFSQISSLASFLLPSKRVGGSLLFTGYGAPLSNPVVAAVERAKNAKPEFRQEPLEVHWTDPVTGEARKCNRIDGPVYFYYISDSAAELANLTEQEIAWLKDDAKTLFGDAEYAEYFENGNEPERWADQPDAKMRRA